MEKSNSYKDLKVWQKALELAKEIYRLTEHFPKTEVYGLVSQMRRASVAVPSNIAEGQRRGHHKEFLQFLYISYGSGAELETQIEICKSIDNLKGLNYTKSEQILEEVMKMLNGLIKAIKQKTN